LQTRGIYDEKIRLIVLKIENLISRKMTLIENLINQICTEPYYLIEISNGKWILFG
jgi:hypothetical protein